jgi:integral membrane sensor domain MASE1
MNPFVRPTRSTASWLLFSLALAVAYCLTGRLCIAASAMVANVSWMLFIPAGLSLTGSLLWGWRVAPAVLVGELLVGVTSHEPLPASGLMALGNALDCALAGWWFHDRPRRRLEFDRLQDVVALLLVELIVLEPVSTIFGMIGLNTAGHIPADKLWGTATAWYTANIFAKLLMAPTVLVWLRWPRPAVSRRNALELVLLTVFVLVLGGVGVGRWAQHSLPLPVTLIFVLPLLVWAAVRFPPSVGVTVGCVFGLFAFDAVLTGMGPFGAHSGGDHIVYLNIFMGVCIGTAVFLTAAMAQHQKFEDEQARLIEELRQSAAQVRRLEDLVTFCAWTSRVRWRDKWVSIEQFLHERFNLSVSHGISDEGIATLRQSMQQEMQNGQKPPESGT